MKTTDLADATARALDLLPPGDPARSDPRLLRDARLIEEARLTRETVTDVWLAVSPLHVAPPDVLKEVLAEINPVRPANAVMDHRLLKFLAVGGWAAAALLLVAFLLDSDERSSFVESPLDPIDSPAEPLAEAPALMQNSRDGRLRGEILRLQNRLTEARENPKAASPRVITLRAPGAPARSPEDSQRRVQSILTNALQSALEAESGAASLVIERGWLAGGLPALEEGGVVRHRNFPEHSWRELGLLRSDDGSYYDSHNGLVWTPDLEGHGFVGRQATEADDLTHFHADDENPSSQPTMGPRTEPEGFIVENPANKNAEVIIDQVPKPAAGNTHEIVITDSRGNKTTTTIGLPSETIPQGAAQIAGTIPYKSVLESIGNLTSQNTGVSSTGLMIGNNGTLIFTIPSGASLNSFQLIERPLVANGLPARVIVESQP